MTVWGGFNKGIISKGVGQAKEEGLVQWSSNSSVHQNHPEDLLKHTLLDPIPRGSESLGMGLAWESTILSFQVMLILPVQQWHFENHVHSVVNQDEKVRMKKGHSGTREGRDCRNLKGNGHVEKAPKK